LPGLPSRSGSAANSGSCHLRPAVLMSALLGAVLYLLVFRQLRSAPPVAKAVRLGRLMVMLQALFATVGYRGDLGRGDLPRGRCRSAGTGSRRSLVVRAGDRADRVTLSLLMRFTASTRYPRRSRNRKGGRADGPVTGPHRRGDWALELCGRRRGRDPDRAHRPLVPARTPCSSWRRWRRHWSRTSRAGRGRGRRLVIGMLQSELTFLQARHTWLPQHGLAEMVPLVLILAVLVVVDDAAPARRLTLRSPGHAPAPRRVATRLR